MMTQADPENTELLLIDLNSVLTSSKTLGNGQPVLPHATV